MELRADFLSRLDYQGGRGGGMMEVPEGETPYTDHNGAVKEVPIKRKAGGKPGRKRGAAGREASPGALAVGGGGECQHTRFGSRILF